MTSDDVSQSAYGFDPSSSMLPELIDTLKCLAVWKILLFVCHRPCSEIANGILLCRLRRWPNDLQVKKLCTGRV